MLLEKLEKSLEDAFNESLGTERLDSKSLHSARSKAWVKYLANSFRSEYQDPEYRVFSSDYAENRTEFKLNEFLFDISVVSIGSFSSASNKKKLKCVTGMEWAIESEFQRSDSRASIIDFSKLVMARSKNKLLILPQSKKIKDWALSVLAEAIPNDGDNYFLAFVPHPEHWTSKLNVELYAHGKDGWVSRREQTPAI